MPPTQLTDEQMRAAGATHVKRYDDGSVLYFRTECNLGRDCDAWRAWNGGFTGDFTPPGTVPLVPAPTPRTPGLPPLIVRYPSLAETIDREIRASHARHVRERLAPGYAGHCEACTATIERALDAMHAVIGGKRDEMIETDDGLCADIVLPYCAAMRPAVAGAFRVLGAIGDSVIADLGARTVDTRARGAVPLCGCHCTGGCADPYAPCARPCLDHMPY